MKIILIGFMGAGKTSLAKLLRKTLSMEYIDMDQVIINLSGRSSDREIFDLDGEKKFRELEAQVAKNLKDKINVVISTGGGVVMNKTNMDNLKTNGITIYLKNSFETSSTRISKKNPPPLFRDLKKAKELYEIREPLYTSFADIIISTDNLKLAQIEAQVISQINNYEKNS